MIFFNRQNSESQKNYLKYLTKVGALSNLFSDNLIPYINYRTTEIAFCKAFSADNLSRSDTSADAGKEGLGIGIKTFINGNGSSFQKVAEFNRDVKEIRSLSKDPKNLALAVSNLRNRRLEFAKDLHSLKELIYHCIARDEQEFILFEEKMTPIDIQRIKIINSSDKIIDFSDGQSDYKFNLSKSTLLKRFTTVNEVKFSVPIIKDPFDYLDNFDFNRIQNDIKVEQKVVLPLYSLRGEKHVPEFSGLNQWNASGRTRKLKEVYIPIPLWIHKVFPDFFPERSTSFNLLLPNKKIINVSVVQEGGKALMSNPNTDLGEWLIDEVLKINPGTIVTYSLLEQIGVDSVELTKINNDLYYLNFKKVGAYEEFYKFHYAVKNENN